MRENYFNEKERELKWEERWEIIEEITCNMSDKEGDLKV